MHDIIIIGAGPAGRALAAACAAQGLDAICVAPAPDAPWPNNYGSWIDELAPLNLAQTVGKRWPKAAVRFDAEHAVVLDRPYGNMDGRALQAALVASTLDGVVEAVRDDGVVLADGRVIEGRLVVDAAGANAQFSSRRGHHAPGFQRALGLDLQVDAHPFALDTMQLMDFSAAPATPETDPDGPPSFVYVMPHGPERIFVEETSLVGRPAVDLDVLEARLRARLADWGIAVRTQDAVERCHIPMGGALPDFGHPVLAYGAAAGMTHPATGYMLTHALRCAEPAARALAAALPDVDAARMAYWEAVWPRDKQRLWQLYRFGMEVLLRLDQTATRAFFGGFFTLDAERQAAWLAGTMTVNEASATMMTMFKALPMGLRMRLIGHGMRPHGWRMLGALMR